MPYDNTKQSIENLQKLFDLPKDKEVIKFESYLEEHKDRLLEILSDDVSYNLVAPMASGKTTTLLEIAAESKIKVIMLMPLVSLVKQKAKSFLEKGIILGRVHGSDKENDQGATTSQSILTHLLDNDPIISVYDSLPHIISVIQKEIIKENPLKDYVLIIDESHNLVTQSNFRLAAIYKIINAIDKFKKVIYLTGTPECTKLNKDKTIQFVKNAPSKSSLTHLIYYKSNGLHKLFNHVMSLQNIKGKVVIIIDNRKDLIFFKELLIQNKRVTEKKISVISRHDKSEDTYLAILDEERIPENVQFLLSTRIISDGVNIFDEDIEHLYFLNVSDYWLKRQFISRFRNGVENIYDFTRENNIKYSVIGDYRAAYKAIKVDRVDFRKDLQKHYNRGRYSRDKVVNILLSSPIRNNRDRVIYFDDDEKAFKIIEQKIALILIDKINNAIKSNESLAKYFYSTICHHDVKSCLSYEKLLEKKEIKEYLDEKAFTNEKNNYEMDIDYDNYDSLHYHMDKILTISARRQGKSKYFDKNNNRSNFIFDYDHKEQDEFYKKNRRIFNKLEQTLEFIIDLLIQNYPDEFIEHIFKLGHQGNKSTEINKLKVILSSHADKSIIENYPPLTKMPFITHSAFNNLIVINSLIKYCNDKVEVSDNDLKPIYDKLRKDKILDEKSNFLQFKLHLRGVYNCSIKRQQKTENKNITREYYTHIYHITSALHPILDYETDLSSDMKKLISDNWTFIYSLRARHYLDQFIADSKGNTIKKYANIIRDLVSISFTTIST